MNIKEHTDRLTAFFESCIDGIITINNRGIIESVNPAAGKLFGYEPEKLLGKNVNMLMPQPHHSNHDGYLNAYATTGVKKIIGIGREVSGKRSDGSTFPFWLTISEASLGGEKIFTGVIHDLSDLRKVEKAFKESENRLSSIIESAVDGIITINTKGVIETMNPAAAKLFGYTPSEVVGNNISSLMPEPHKSNHDGYLHQYLTTGVKKIIGIGREVDGRKKDSTTFPFRLSVSKVDLGTRIIFTGIIHDLTEERAATEEISQLNAELERKVKERTEKLADVVNKLLSTNQMLEQEVQERKATQSALYESREEVKKALIKERELSVLKSRFVSMASHEFRTPLSTILSSASLISKYTEIGTEEKRAKHVERIKSAVSNLTGILNDFLSLSKLEEGKIDAKYSEFNIIDLVHEIVDEIKHVLKKGQFITYEHHGKSALVYLDKHFVKNIMINLLSNASKYSGTNSEIILTTTKNDQLKIEVKDRGIGIPAEDQEHMFERFFRANNATNIQGTGLGLNIVNKYVEMMKGKISFVSKIEEGSTFTVLLPHNK